MVAEYYNPLLAVKMERKIVLPYGWERGHWKQGCIIALAHFTSTLKCIVPSSVT